MKYLALLLIFPIIAATDCGKKNKPTDNVTIGQEIKDTVGMKDTIRVDDTIETKIEDPTKSTPPGDKKETIPSKDSVPPCIRKMIEESSKEGSSDFGTQVDEYLYNGKKVYGFTAPCCDQFNVVYDENCKAICAPSGGFTGKGDGKCPDFEKNSKRIKTIWKKSPK